MTLKHSILVRDNKDRKLVRSKDYNFNFDKKTGLFMRWGETQEDDPNLCPLGPEILDIEISVNGCPNACPFCYKNNRDTAPTNMSHATFTAILDRISRCSGLVENAVSSQTSRCPGSILPMISPMKLSNTLVD
jgi:hypothetical protein